MTVDSYLHRGQKWVARWAGNDRIRRLGRAAAWAGAGFFLSAGGLSHRPMPFAMALVSAMTGWRSLLAGLGAAGGYLLFWGPGGLQGSLWTALSCLSALALGKHRLSRQVPLLIPALCGLFTAALGLGFLLLGEDVPTGIYLLRVVLAPAASLLFLRLKKKREPVLVWLGQGIALLALAQIAPLPWLSLGYPAAAVLTVTGAFPAAAIGGFALDLARITPVSMTAVLCGAWLLRLIPGIPKWLRLLSPGAVFLLISPLLAGRDLSPLAGLLLGGLIAGILPEKSPGELHRGDLGPAQLRLEISAQVLNQARLLLMEQADTPIDEEALMARTRERACGGCPNRRACHVPERIPPEYLRRPMTENTALPFPCRKAGRMVLEIRRTQEQYRLLRADRERRREYRQAVIQQYGFLSEYLRELSDTLPRRGPKARLRFRPEAASASRSREPDNGDRCIQFTGPGGRFFLLLCDGMGTGMGAAQDGRSACRLLRQLLGAGFPPEHALSSLNSLLALGSRAGAVTVDLAAVELDTGAVALYKWGASPSYLLRGNGAEKIGTAGPPPGIGMADTRETVDRLSLRRGEALIILSDGVDGEAVRRCAVIRPEGPSGELAARLLEAGAAESADDATVAVLRLHPADLLT